MTDLLAATISMTSTADFEKNLLKAEDLVRKASGLGAKWVMLPEMVSFMGSYDQLFKIADEEETGVFYRRMSALAKELKIVLFAGSIPEKPKAHEEATSSAGYKKVFNTFYIFGQEGEVLAKYRKTHLFNLLTPEGNPLYCEDDGFIAGNSLVSVNIDGFQVGLAICYDLRFPELFLSLNRQSLMDVIAIPSAFTLMTGKDHWEPLLRARAIEFQCYVYSSNQTGTHSPGKQTYGHSMIVDPWGHKIADTGDLEGVAIALISRNKIQDSRAKIPVWSNRRPDVYQLV